MYYLGYRFPCSIEDNISSGLKEPGCKKRTYKILPVKRRKRKKRLTVGSWIYFIRVFMLALNVFQVLASRASNSYHSYNLEFSNVTNNCLSVSSVCIIIVDKASFRNSYTVS